MPRAVTTGKPSRGPSRWSSCRRSRPTQACGVRYATPAVGLSRFTRNSSSCSSFRSPFTATSIVPSGSRRTRAIALGLEVGAVGGPVQGGVPRRHRGGRLARARHRERDLVRACLALADLRAAIASRAVPGGTRSLSTMVTSVWSRAEHRVGGRRGSSVNISSLSFAVVPGHRDQSRVRCLPRREGGCPGHRGVVVAGRPHSRIGGRVVDRDLSSRWSVQVDVNSPRN